VTDETLDAEAFATLTDKIARERGFGAAHYKGTCLRRRIAVRMRARGARDFAEYIGVLDRDPGEYERLIDALTINVSKLFRNADTWRAVARHVMPALWALPAPTIRTWVAGCAAGEEAFTVAALWHRQARAAGGLDRLSRVHVAATDIDRACLEAAGRGAFTASALEETPADVRDEFFGRSGPFVASDALRRLVHFERRDILQEPPPRGPLHLITCRNVIIYFDRAAQDALMQRFFDALVPGGFLVLGKVETLLGASRGLFQVVDQRQRIFRRP
jgi:chemotaxis methyl-accepting protein methylase